jgi:hypothetical protein
LQAGGFQTKQFYWCSSEGHKQKHSFLHLFTAFLNSTLWCSLTSEITTQPQDIPRKTLANTCLFKA